MQRAYFLGGATPNGFETAFWREQAACYGFYLKGGPGTGKSTLMKKVAAAFSEERVSVYACASDPRSLDAVVLEDRGVFIADATAPHESSTPLPFVTGETVDLAAGLHAEKLLAPRDAVLALYAENQAAHAQARKGLRGIGAMEDTVAAIGEAALLREKLAGFTARLARRILGGKAVGETKAPRERQMCAITPSGKITLYPEGYSVLRLTDPYYAASQAVLRGLAEQAAAKGIPCEVTRSQTQTCRPITMVCLPEQQLVVAAAGQPETAHAAVRSLLRFYDADRLRAQRTLARFCAKNAEALTAQTTAILSDALAVHDALETHYIAALDRTYLDRVTAEIIAAIRART